MRLLTCLPMALLSAASTTAESQTDRAGFITRLGNDTIAIETFARTANRIEGDIAIRNPRTRTIHYVATLGSNGTVTEFDMTSVLASAPAGTPPVIERSTSISDTTLSTEVRRNGVRDTSLSGTVQVPKRGAVPFVQSGTAFLEQMVRQRLTAGVDSIEVPQFTFGPNGTFPSYVRRTGASTVEINLGAPLIGTLDKSGRLVSLSGRSTTVKTETVRIQKLDLTSIVAAWAAAERSGELAGPVSGRDTVRATVGSAEIWVDYGRPMRRGRTIFGALVPWDSVWRTGANAATQFKTSTDITVGGASVPAGTYTLWTIPTSSGATLIINKQNGQWGTQYDSKQDLVRVPLRVETTSSPVDKFTLDVASGPSPAMLRFAWDTRQFSIPIVVK